MAKQPGKSKKTKPEAASEEVVQDAEIVDATPENERESDEDLDRALSEDPDTADLLTETEAVLEDTADEPVEVSEETPQEPEIAVETPETEVEKAPEIVNRAPAPAERPSVFIPMLLGGLLAGGIGYAIAYAQYGNQQAGEPMASASELAALEARLDELPPPVDLSPLTTQIEDVQAGIADLGARIDNDIADLSGRIEAVERQPNADGTLTDTAVAAFEEDLRALRQQMSDQQAELLAMADQTTEDLEATRAQAQEVQSNAVEAARKATARAALARVQGALETGSSFAAILPELESALDGPVPAPIAEVADGVATLGTLQAEFPAVARAALGTARSEGVSGEETSGFGAFLRNQFDVRSVAPQEGDSVDAVLSRAQAALSAGRLNEALAETAALPEVVRAEMSDWIGVAEARASALEAADSLATSLTD